MHRSVTQSAQKRERYAYANIAVLTVCAGTALVGVGLFAGQASGSIANYILGLLLFAALTTAFLISRLQRGATGLFDLPVFLSVLGFLQLGLAPLAIFLEPWNLAEFVTEDGLVRALFLCIAGMMAFWGGTLMFSRRFQPRPASEGLGVPSPAESSRLTIIACALFATGCIARAYLLKEQMYGFVASMDRVQANLGLVSTFGFVSKASTAGLLIIAIEKYSSPRNRQIDFIFWPMLAIQCGWGLISGMKGELLVNFVLVAAVSSICAARFSWKWLATPVIVFIVVYPLNNAYRQLVREEGQQVNDFESAAQVGNSAVSARSRMGAGDFLSTGVGDGLSRLDALTSVTQLMSIGPMKAMLEGEERLWMIPFYPFIPRLLWKEKPTLYKGQRFTILLGGDPMSSTALTYPGDCYVLGGQAGVIFGMFMWGVLAEALVQFLYRKASKARIFVYVMMCFSFTAPPIESTVFGLWTSILQQMVTFGFLALLIYGYGRGIGVRRHRVPAVTSGRSAELIRFAGQQ